MLANHFLPIEHLHTLDVGMKTPLRPAIGMADVVTDLRDFAAVFALCHVLALPQFTLVISLKPGRMLPQPLPLDKGQSDTRQGTCKVGKKNCDPYRKS
jgi:hypothetical protein